MLSVALDKYLDKSKLVPAFTETSDFDKEIFGASVSFTVTFNWAVDSLPDESFALIVKVWTPSSLWLSTFPSTWGWIAPSKLSVTST